jgi:tripartite-type tricarboxylate transporter receptor subunit TctC
MGKLAIGVIAALVMTAAHGQDFPSRAITLVVPNPPGGVNQLHAQPLGAVIEKLYKQPAPVLNKAGATGAAGTAFVANQPPDGYTLLVNTPNIILVVEKDKLFGIQSPYTLERIAPVALFSADPMAISVQAGNSIQSVDGFLATARAKQGSMSFSSSGLYSITHVPLEMLLHLGKAKMRHVPTTGGGTAIIQLLGGHVDVTMQGVGSTYPHLKAGKLRALAVSSAKRTQALPDVATLKEAGYDVEAYLWAGLFTAAGVPQATFTKLREVIRTSVADPLFQDTLTKGGIKVEFMDAPQFREFFDADHRRLALAIKTIGRLEEQSK